MTYPHTHTLPGVNDPPTYTYTCMGIGPPTFTYRKGVLTHPPSYRRTEVMTHPPTHTHTEVLTLTILRVTRLL